MNKFKKYLSRFLKKIFSTLFFRFFIIIIYKIKNERMVYTMANFMESLKNEVLTEDYNVAYSENGARGYATTGTSLLDFSFKLSNYRSANELCIQKDFEKAWLEMPEYALKYLFYAGDIREGMGERKVFKACLKYLANVYPEKIKNVIKM